MASDMHLSRTHRALAIARHYWQKLKANTLGRLFVSSGGKKLRRELAAFGTRPRAPKLNIAFVAHVFYLDLVEEIIELRGVFEQTVPIHLTVPHDKAAELAKRLSGLDEIHLHPCENRGRDIAPFLSLLSAGVFDTFDAVLKLHTKRSPHLLDGDLRRKLLFASLCGERSATYRMLHAFEESETGLVGWRDCFRTDPVYWMANRDRVLTIAKTMNAEDAMRLGFFEGSMFWFRPKALKPLRELRLQPASFEPEAAQLDGTLHHAIERCFTIAAWSRGYTVRDTRGRVL